MAAVNRDRAAQAIRSFLESLGYDLTRADLTGTPARVVAAFCDELLAGEKVDLAALLRDGSERCASGAGLVVVRDIEVATICPHHLLPALGKATLAYLPGTHLVGLGTLARLVDACARRLSLQEAIGERVVAALVEYVGARGAYCEIELLHSCLAARGAHNAGARLLTAARNGALAEKDGLAELSLLLGR